MVIKDLLSGKAKFSLHQLEEIQNELPHGVSDYPVDRTSKRDSCSDDTSCSSSGVRASSGGGGGSRDVISQFIMHGIEDGA